MKKNLSVIAMVMMLSSVTAYGQIFAPIHGETHNKVACIKTNENEIAALFDRWNFALSTLNPDEVTSEYAHDAVLLPTLSNKPRTNHEEIRDYFVHFLKKKPQGKIETRIIKIGCNTASDTGLYTFTVTEYGKQKKIEARYSFVYEYDDDQWLIEHHHSSLMPEKKPHKHHK